MVPASDDSQTNSCLKNPILMRIRAGYSLHLSASAFPQELNRGDDVQAQPLLLAQLLFHRPSIPTPVFQTLVCRYGHKTYADSDLSSTSPQAQA